MTKTAYGIISVPVIVAALGYFVDIYDLLLFTIVREPSLRALGAVGAVLAGASTLISCSAARSARPHTRLRPRGSADSIS